MLHPSYMELMEKINHEVEEDQPLVQSRYSIVLAAAKRARQITEMEERTGLGDPKKKPLSQAVNELYNGSTRILNEAEIAQEEEKLQALIEATQNLHDAQQEVTLSEDADDFVTDTMIVPEDIDGTEDTQERETSEKVSLSEE